MDFVWQEEPPRWTLMSEKQRAGHTFVEVLGAINNGLDLGGFRDAPPGWAVVRVRRLRFDETGDIAGAERSFVDWETGEWVVVPAFAGIPNTCVCLARL